MNLDTFAAHFFNSGASVETENIILPPPRSVKNLNATAIDKATIIPLHNNNLHHQQSPSHISRSIGDQFFQKVGETLFGFGATSSPVDRVSNSEISSGGPNMDLLRNHIVIDSADFGTSSTTSAASSSELQQQLEYDKFMNEIWIGIVLTLIIISMVFCICSCFLYHQFRQWKRNYRHNLQQTQDIESVKLNPDTDDPVPEYTLVSGLPSYEAALELMQKSTSHNNCNGFGNMGSSQGGNGGSCLIVYPKALFGAFMVNEKESLLMSKSQELSNTTTSIITDATIPQSPSIGGVVTSATTTTTTTTTMTIPMTENVKCQNVPRLALQQYSIPSYEEAMGCQLQLQQQQQQQLYNGSDTSEITTTYGIKSPPTWSEDDTTKTLRLTQKIKDEK